MREALQQLQDADQKSINANTKCSAKATSLQLCLLAVQRKYNYDYKNILGGSYSAVSPETALELKMFIQNALRTTTNRF